MNDVVANAWPAEASAGRVVSSRVLRIPWSITAVMLVAAAVYIGTCAWPVILDETDGQYAGAAREMLARGDWLVPTNNGVPRLQKPPLVYWVTMASMKVFGVNEFAARLPNALATLAWIFATYLIGKRIAGERRGLIAATILGSMMGLFLFTHRIMPEPFLATCISLTIWCFLNALQEFGVPPSGGYPDACSANRPQAELDTRRWFRRAWFFMGLGVLSKGVHGALWPLGIAGASALLQPRARAAWKGLFSISGLAVFLAITVPWYAAMAHRFPGFLAYHFFDEQAGHAFNMNTPRDCEQVPLLTFWAQHLLYLFPWIFLLPAVFAVKREGLSRPRESSDDAQEERGVYAASLCDSRHSTDRIETQLPAGASKRSRLARSRSPITFGNGESLLWIWIAITAITISFSARQDHYSMTCWGALAVCLARPLAERRTSSREQWISLPAMAMALAGALILVAAIAIRHPILASATQVQPEAARDDIHSAIQGLSSEIWRECTPLAVAAGVAMLIGGGFAAMLLARRRTLQGLFMLAGTMARIFPFAMRGYAQLQGYFSLADVARQINHAAAGDALIACEGEPHLSSSLFFYLDRQVSWAGAQTGSIVAAEAHGIPVGPFVSNQDLAATWHSSRPVYFIVEQANLSEWTRRLGIDATNEHIVARDGTRVVLSNERDGLEGPRSNLASTF